MRGFLAVLVALSSVSAFSQSHIPFKNPPTKVEEAKKFMEPKVKGTPASVRMKGYEQRLQMEATSPFSQILWRNVGSEIQGGRVVDFHVPDNDPGTMVVAYATGGLWKSGDQGVTWTPIFDRESSFAIGDFAVGKDGKTIWVGTGENNSQRTSYSGTGVFKSTDGGQTWANMGLWETHRIGRVLINPKNENVVYVGAIGSLYSANPERGVYKTTDGGKTWSHVLKLDDMTGVIDMAMDPRNPDVLYAAAWERDRRAWNFREGGPGTAIYKSTNAGQSWTKLSNGLPPQGDLGRIGIAIAESKPDTVYAFFDNQGGDSDTIWKDEYQPGGILTLNRYWWLTEDEFLKVPKDVLTKFVESYLPRETKVDEIIQQVTDKKITLKDVDALIRQRNPNAFSNDQADAQVYRSDDAGKTWRRTHSRNIGEHQGYYGGRISVSPHNPEEIYFTGVQMFRSDNGGKSFYTVANRAHVDWHVYTVSKHNPNFHAAGSDGGLYLSYDGGKNWRHINSIPVGQYTTIAVDTKTPYNIYGGLQDNGTMKGPSNYRPGISDPSLWKDINGGDGSAIAVDPRDGGDIVYVAFQWGQHTAIDQKNNRRWSTRPTGQGLRFQWISPFIISPHHPDIVYVGSQKLHRSFNQGRRWETISEDLTTNRENGDVPYATLKDLSESPFKFGLIYAGTDDGLVKMTPDGGNTWKDITPAQTRGKWVCRVVASKHEAGTVYLAQTGYREDDWTPYLWKSTDYGTTWTSIVSNLPPEPINVIREDPTTKGMLYVGTDLGVFVSYDDGGKWEPLSGGIPRTPVHDIAIQEQAKEMVIASHARSVFVLKLDKLYETTDEVRKNDLKLWTVDDMTASDRWPYRRAPEWSDRGPEAPKFSGQYWSMSAGNASLRIKDKEGKVIKEKELKAVVGWNFFDLDLELRPFKRLTVTPKPPKTAEEALKDPYEAERAAYVAPGEYVLELQVGAKTVSQPWKLK
ncbi:MAG TPA: hypothetical protein PKA27_14640 [Fimbriimonadaceae bacterium]|nr:hypothetical protein [Fimbriimonadaceae bacterium]